MAFRIINYNFDVIFLFLKHRAAHIITIITTREVHCLRSFVIKIEHSLKACHNAEYNDIYTREPLCKGGLPCPC